MLGWSQQRVGNNIEAISCLTLGPFGVIQTCLAVLINLNIKQIPAPAKQDFDTRVRETKERAIAENIKLAEDTGNKLTQNIDEQGNLVGVANMSTTETTLEKSNEVVSGADIRSELFEGDNIVTRSGNDNNDE